MNEAASALTKRLTQLAAQFPEFRLILREIQLPDRSKMWFVWNAAVGDEDSLEESGPLAAFTDLAASVREVIAAMGDWDEDDVRDPVDVLAEKLLRFVGNDMTSAKAKHNDDSALRMFRLIPGLHRVCGNPFLLTQELIAARVNSAHCLIHR